MKHQSYLVLILLFFCNLTYAHSESAPYYRFWQGKKRQNWPQTAASQIPWAQRPSDYYQKLGFDTYLQDSIFTPGSELTQLQFNFLVNDTLIPATVSCCAKENLLAYVPVLPDAYRIFDGPTSFELVDELIPDEMALIVYKDQESYESWRKIPQNQRPEDLSAEKQEAVVYGPLHGDVFKIPQNNEERKDITSSRSQVPVLYPGKVTWPMDSKLYDKEVAYDLLGSTHDWQDLAARVGFRFWRRSSNISEIDYLKRIETYLNSLKKEKNIWGLLNYVILINDQYVMEYFLVKDINQFLKQANFFSTQRSSLYLVQVSVAKDLSADPHQKELSYPPLRFGEAGRMLFTPGEVSKKKNNWLLKH